MVPKIHAKGCSFRGIAQYLLHDKDRASTSDRVAWTETRNLATDDPQLAWKLCAATAMDADRLKAQAGVKNTGRKSVNSVLHVTLSWHPDEAEDLTPEEMKRAADQAIGALGAQSRQAMIVAHNDEQQPHVHLVINRVSPEDGRMLSSSKEKLALSKWSLAYEKQRGEILCEQRAINAAARDRGEYVRGEKDIPRHIYEQHLANDNRPDRAERHRVQRDKDREVGRAQRVIRDRQSAAWAKLTEDHRAKRSSILAQQKAETLRAKTRIQAEYRNTRWKRLYHEHRAEMRAFERDEGRFLGRMKNRLRSVDFKELVGGDRRVQTIGRAFNALSSSGARREWLKRDQARRERALRAEQKASEADAARAIRSDARERLAKARVGFQTERASLVFRCALENAKMRAEWRQRAHDREASVEQDLTPDSEPTRSIAKMIDTFNEMRSKSKQRPGRDQDLGSERSGDDRDR